MMNLPTIDLPDMISLYEQNNMGKSWYINLKSHFISGY